MQVYEITVSGSLLQQAKKLVDGNSLMTRLARVMKEENAYTVSHIQQTYMSFPKDQPPTMDGLRADTNRLRNSLNAKDPDVSGGKLDSGIGSNVVYALIQEIGGQTRAHDIVARNADFLAFIPGGGGSAQFSEANLMARLKGIRGNARKAAKKSYFDETGVLFRKRVHHPGSDIPARQYVQRGIEDRLNDYNLAFNGEIQKTLTA